MQTKKKKKMFFSTYCRKMAEMPETANIQWPVRNFWLDAGDILK